MNKVEQQIEPSVDAKSNQDSSSPAAENAKDGSGSSQLEMSVSSLSPPSETEESDAEQSPNINPGDTNETRTPHENDTLDLHGSPSNAEQEANDSKSELVQNPDLNQTKPEAATVSERTKTKDRKAGGSD